MEVHRTTKAYIYTDGAARGNPGPSASGYAIYDADHRHLASHEAYNGIKTNNFAEYSAVILALEWCRENIEDCSGLEVELSSDSELVVKQMNGHYKVKSEALASLNARSRTLAGEFRSVKLINVPRENPEIVKVDSALNRLLDKLSESNKNV